MSRTRKTEPVTPEYLNPREVAQRLGLSQTTVYKLALTGELRSIKVGKAVRINAESLREWCQRMEEKRLDDTAVLRYG